MSNVITLNVGQVVIYTNILAQKERKNMFHFSCFLIRIIIYMIIIIQDSLLDLLLSRDLNLFEKLQNYTMNLDRTKTTTNNIILKNERFKWTSYGVKQRILNKPSLTFISTWTS